jgi:hypothetical protein
MWTARIGAAALLGLAAAGCGPGPFTRAASAYAAANEASASAIASAPTTATRVCRKKAHVSYLQARLGILLTSGAPGPDEPALRPGPPATPEDIPWNKWYATAKATEKQTWAQYCAEMAATGKVFSVAVGALRQYGAALKSLTEAGAYDGSDIQKAAEAASVSAQALGNESAAAAAKPVGTLLGRFATFLLDDVTEDQIEPYVRRADPLIQPLVEGMERYIEALEAELKVAENTQRQTLLALEVRSGLSSAGADPDKLLIFYGFALETEHSMQDTRAVLEGYKGVLRKLRTAHGAMVKAGAAGNELDIKQTLGSVFDLLTQIQALNSALTKE